MSVTKGQKGIAVSCGKLGTGPIVSINNNVGGTTELPEGRYRVEIIREFYDYEVGVRLHGRLLDAEQIASSRKTGEVLKPEWEGLSLPLGYAKTAMETIAIFDPTLVMFHSNDFLPGENA